MARLCCLYSPARNGIGALKVPLAEVNKSCLQSNQVAVGETAV